MIRIVSGHMSGSVTVEGEVIGESLRLAIHVPVPASTETTGRCVPVTLEFDRVPVVQVTSLAGRPISSRLDFRDVDQRIFTATAQACAWAQPSALVVVEGELDEPLVVTTGSVTSVRLPAIEGPVQSEAPSSFSVAWVVESPANDLKAEVVSPGYRGPGLRWPAADDDVVFALKHWYSDERFGTFTSVSAEKAANRSLFWAGLLAGAAVSVLAWAGELVLEGRRERGVEERRRQEREELIERVADVVTLRVVSALEGRAAAEEARPQRPSRRRSWWRLVQRLRGRSSPTRS
ncbi:hypothetical protein [Nonomuraea maheshkhaliensis]